MLRAEDVCLELFFDWLAQNHSRHFQIKERSYLEPSGLSALASDGSYQLCLEVRHLLPPPEDEVWYSYRQQLEKDIAVDLPGAYALWLPPGADLPREPHQAMDFAQRVQAIAFKLEKGQRSYVPLPANLYLRKVRTEGNLMSVAGVLDKFWAKMSERVHGSYDLDSTTMHRLPEDEEHRRQLFDRISEEAEKIQNTGQWVAIETIDAWTVQRLKDGFGVAIIGVPPEAIADMGNAVRRNLRRILVEVSQNLAEQTCDLRALIILGPYPYINQEGATTALRGYDPTIYSSLDFICLASDGQIKALKESPVLPWAR